MFGNKLRELREEKGLVLREVAEFLKVDTATISKIERGDRQSRKEQLPLLSEILEININELKSIWLADRILRIVKDEKFAEKSLKMVETELIALKCQR
jgi:transcriptional regulator with XRE-family HTH domain